MHSYWFFINEKIKHARFSDYYLEILKLVSLYQFTFLQRYV